MKKILFYLFLALLIAPSAVAHATSYPATCPSEAQAIVSGVGGCPAIDCTKFATICDKCCPVVSRQIVVDHPTPKKEPTPAKTIPVQPAAPQISTTLFVFIIIVGIIFWGTVLYGIWHFFKWLLHYFKR